MSLHYSIPRLLCAIAPLACLCGLLTGTATAQQAVAVGKGSYAEFPPQSAGPAAAEMCNRKFPLVEPNDRPIPTNKLWTALLEGKPAGSLWMYPWRVDPRETGLELHFPLKWMASGSDPLCDAPLRIVGSDFRTRELKVKDWGDWTLSFRLPQTTQRYLDVTVGEGMPIVWIESHGVELTINAGRDAKFDTSRKDALVISASGRLYAVFVQPGTRFVESSGRMVLKKTAEKSFAAIAALKSTRDLNEFAKCAYSIPRGSRMDWAYDARRGKVTTTWTVKTEPLLPGKPDIVMQGWLAHQWRDAATGMKLDGPEYLTSRGVMRTSLGNGFQWVYDFDGFLPNLPAAESAGSRFWRREKRLRSAADRATAGVLCERS